MANDRETIFLGSDHSGFETKEFLKNSLLQQGFLVEDLGPSQYDPDDDYPDYAFRVCGRIAKNKGRGILVCGSGQGMSMVANKLPGIRAAVCWDEDSAKQAKEHLDINVLCLGGKAPDKENILNIVKVWIETPSSGEARHERRREKTRRIEDKNFGCC